MRAVSALTYDRMLLHMAHDHTGEVLACLHCVLIWLFKLRIPLNLKPHSRHGYNSLGSWHSMCCAKYCLVRNILLHSWQACDLARPCRLKCARMLSLNLNVFWHMEHAKFLSSECDIICDLRPAFVLNDLLHKVQLHGKLSELIFMCVLNDALVLKFAGHCWHLNSCQLYVHQTYVSSQLLDFCTVCCIFHMEIYFLLIVSRLMPFHVYLGYLFLTHGACCKSTSIVKMHIFEMTPEVSLSFKILAANWTLRSCLYPMNITCVTTHIQWGKKGFAALLTFESSFSVLVMCYEVIF